ncbi:MAG: Uma2 family endonuclease [Candidatus Poribacteria bacterium]|nr:Uma2 family endonuclease [Candidatus Poribacteria bacterium]MDE0503009.1 Uma2 family endonuclease [Candidatus Poribacteria bacterium]
MSSAAVQSHMTPEEYLALERKATIKSEYLNGKMYAMSGASREHNIISGNIFVALYLQLRERSCEIYSNDMRLKVSAAGLYTYADIVVVCDEPRFEDGSVDTLLNPTALFEVLSPSTEAYDRGAKFGYYRQLDTIQEYTLVSQDSMRVEHYLRHNEQWILTESGRPDDVVRLTSIDCELSLREIYAKVEFPPTDALDHQVSG